MAGSLWDKLMNDHPDWLGPINPNNALIESIFGDQGGYWNGVLVVNLEWYLANKMEGAIYF